MKILIEPTPKEGESDTEFAIRLQRYYEELDKSIREKERLKEQEKTDLFFAQKLREEFDREAQEELEKKKQREEEMRKKEEELNKNKKSKKKLIKIEKRHPDTPDFKIEHKDNFDPFNPNSLQYHNYYDDNSNNNRFYKYKKNLNNNQKKPKVLLPHIEVILDTNVIVDSNLNLLIRLILSPYVKVTHIPYVVVEEMDHLEKTKKSNEIFIKLKTFTYILEKVCKSVKRNNVEIQKVPFDYDENRRQRGNNDRQILKLASNTIGKNKYNQQKKIYLISKDRNLGIRCLAYQKNGLTNLKNLNMFFREVIDKLRNLQKI